MSKPQHARRGFMAAARGAAQVALVLLAACVAAVGAQSGRHSQKTSTQPLPEATPQGESGSKPGASSKPSDALVSFVVMEYNGALIGVSSMSVDDLADIFARRLGQPKAVSVTRAGRGVAEHSSMVAAIKLAAHLARTDESGSLVVNAE